MTSIKSDHLSPDEIAAMPCADHNEVISMARKEQAALFAEAPEFLADCEDVDPSVCPLGVLVDLIRRAPSTGLRMMLLDKYEMREEISQLTGRSFS